MEFGDFAVVLISSRTLTPLEASVKIIQVMSTKHAKPLENAANRAQTPLPTGYDFVADRIEKMRLLAHVNSAEVVDVVAAQTIAELDRLHRRARIDNALAWMFAALGIGSLLSRAFAWAVS